MFNVLYRVDHSPHHSSPHRSSYTGYSDQYQPNHSPAQYLQYNKENKKNLWICLKDCKYFEGKSKKYSKYLIKLYFVDIEKGYVGPLFMYPNTLYYFPFPLKSVTWHFPASEWNFSRTQVKGVYPGSSSLIQGYSMFQS